MQGFVAVLDVLGFSAMLGGEGSDARLSAYSSCLSDALSGSGASSSLRYLVFSDSIVLYVPGDTQAAFYAMATACANLLAVMLSTDIPIRGAIAHGSYTVASVPTGDFMAGRAIVDAYRFEQQQNWVGIMVAPSALRKVPNLKGLCQMPLVFANNRTSLADSMEWAAVVRPYENIPFHAIHPGQANVFDGFAIVPNKGNKEPVFIDKLLRECRARLQWLKSIAPDPAAQTKYWNTDRWFTDLLRDLNGIVEHAQTIMNRDSNAV